MTEQQTDSMGFCGGWRYEKEVLGKDIDKPPAQVVTCKTCQNTNEDFVKKVFKEGLPTCETCTAEWKKEKAVKGIGFGNQTTTKPTGVNEAAFFG